MGKMNDKQIRAREFAPHKWDEPFYEEFDIRKVDNYEIGGVDTRDYPDFCDAYLEGADYDGKPCTEEQLDYIQDNYPEIINELAFESLIP